MDSSRLLDNYLGTPPQKNISKFFTKILCCLIFLFASLIFTSYSEENLALYHKWVFEENFNFMAFKNFYQNIASSNPKKDEDKMVFGQTLEYTNITPYQNGQSLEIGVDVPINSLGGGIVVFVGEKEGFNKTIIIQGSDGYDIWYGNLENIDINIYGGYG